MQLHHADVRPMKGKTAFEWAKAGGHAEVIAAFGTPST